MELLLRIAHFLLDQDLAKVRLSAKYLNEALCDTFRNRCFKDVNIRFVQSDLARFDLIARNLSTYVKKVTIDTASFAVLTTRTDVRHDELGPALSELELNAALEWYWNIEALRVFETAISQHTIRGPLCLLTSLEEFHVSQPALGDELKEHSVSRLESLCSRLL